MYAIYWHARDIDGIICVQGHAQAKTIESARKIEADSKYMAANNDITRSWWSCIVPEGGPLEFDICEI